MAKDANKTPTGKPQKRGSVGPATVAAVDALVKSGLKKGEAIKKVAADSMRTVGTVTVTYYRLSGKQKKQKLPKPVKGRVPARRARQPKATGSVSQLLDELAMVLRDQEAEIARLRKENARFEEIRMLLK